MAFRPQPRGDLLAGDLSGRPERCGREVEIGGAPGFGQVTAHRRPEVAASVAWLITTAVGQNPN